MCIRDRSAAACRGSRSAPPARPRRGRWPRARRSPSRRPRTVEPASPPAALPADARAPAPAVTSGGRCPRRRRPLPQQRPPACRTRRC
eukprot:5463731-Prymnesium_polylepis.1